MDIFVRSLSLVMYLTTFTNFLTFQLRFLDAILMSSCNDSCYIVDSDYPTEVNLFFSFFIFFYYSVFLLLFSSGLHRSFRALFQGSLLSLILIVLCVLLYV